MKHVCLAYFPKSHEERSQTIEEHISRGLEFLEEVYLKRKFADYLVRLAQYLGIELSPQESRNALYASYIFHDLGKLSKEYQEKKTSFRGHEIISAYWIIKHGDQLSLREMLYPVALSIYLHHHDIRKTIPKEIQNVDLCSECLRTIINMYKKKTFIDLISYETRFRGELHTRLTNFFYKIKKGDERLKYIRLSYPLLQVVHGADNYSALEREGKQSILSVEIRKVLDAVQLLRENFGGVFR